MLFCLSSVGACCCVVVVVCSVCGCESKSYLYHNVDMLHVRVFMYSMVRTLYMYMHVQCTCS